MRTIFKTRDGQIRAGWRLLLWFAIALGLQMLIGYIAGKLNLPDHSFLDPGWLIADDLLSTFLPAVIATLVMMKIERRTLADYYIPSSPFGKLFWRGIAWGGASVSLLIGLIALAGGYRITGLANHGGALIRAFILWIFASLVIGIVEEFAFRAYMLRTLADGIGFWPAGILLATGFGALHYFTKPYERWEDFACTGLLALALTLTIRRTGNIAFAMGWHAAFDWGAIYFWSGRNAGEYAAGRFFSTSWPGSDRITGGLLGPEASWMVFVVIALLFVAFTRIFSRSAKEGLSQARATSGYN